MKKTLAIFKREYLAAVRKKMFIIMTFLMPLLMIGAFMVPTMLMEGGLGEKRVAVIDGTGQLGEAFKGPEKAEKSEMPMRRGRDIPQQMAVEYVAATGADADKAAKPYVARLGEKNGFDGVFVIPPDALTTETAKLKYYSRAATDFMTQGRLASRTNRYVQERRLASRGMTSADIEKLLTELTVQPVQISKSGEEKKGGVANFFVGFILVALLFIPSFIYGLETMRGIIQEKTDRVVEVLVSSVSAKQLLVGKVLGVAAVGLTQIGIWLTMAALAGGYFATAAKVGGDNSFQLLRASTFLYFIIFFLLSYMTYVCVYAIGGSVCNSEKEAQQLIMPITMTMMLPWFLMGPIITNPESKLAVGLSLAPVWGPLTMYVRTLVAEPPMWHVAVSIVVSLITISLFFWITAKIFRVGILSYGKRPTIPELWKWLKIA